MINCFWQLSTKHTRVIVLQAMLFSSRGRPTSIMEHKPDEEFALGQSAGFTEQFFTFDRVLPNEESQVR